MTHHLPFMQQENTQILSKKKKTLTHNLSQLNTTSTSDVHLIFCLPLNPHRTVTQQLIRSNTSVSVTFQTTELSFLSSPQICVGKLEDGEVFLKLSSGKKRGLVPADSIEEI